MMQLQEFIFVTGFFDLYTMVHLVRTWYVSLVRTGFCYVGK